MATPLSILKELGLSDTEAGPYLSLQSGGALTAQELVKATHGRRPTVYYALRQLQERGLITKSLTPGVARFQAEPAAKLADLLKIKHRDLETLEARLAKILPQLEKQASASEGVPTVLFYEGETAMKRVIMETLYCHSRHIDSIAPSDNFFWQIENAFSESYIRERVTRNITTRNLWERPLEPEIMVRSYKGLSQVRILPKAMRDRFRTTVFIYDDKVMYISSKQSGYVLLVRSREHNELMRAMFDGYWDASNPVKS